MPLTPQNLNPLQDYVTPGSGPANTVDGLILDGVYGVTGVVNTVGTNMNSYQDPATGQISNLSNLQTPANPIQTQWVSGIVDDAVNTTYTLDFQFNRDTYSNFISFEILQVPCQWTLSQVSGTTVTQLSTGIVSAYNTERFQQVVVKLGSTYQFSTSTSLRLTLVKSLTGTQYNFKVYNFLVKLITQQYSDLSVGGTTISGVTTQNTLGFVENYSPIKYSLTNMNDREPNNFWKCSPQPVGDAIVYFIIDFQSLKTINQFYIDPLYTGTVFNLYYSYDGNVWSPVNNDFRLKKGVYEVPPILTRYLKFELTQLTPEPYALPFDSILKTVNVFPDWVDNLYTNIERAIPDIANQAYAQTSAITPTVGYNRQVSSNTILGTATNSLNGISYGGVTSPGQSQLSNAVAITDPTVSYKTLQDVAGMGSTYNPISDVAFITRRFPTSTTHIYKQVNVNQTWHEAYFTGIKTLLFYGTDQSVQMDYPDFTDYLTTNISNKTIISGTATTASFVNPVIVSISGNATISGGGYTGLAGTVVNTKNLQTYTQFTGFKMATLSSDWVPFLSNAATTLQGNNPNVLFTNSSNINTPVNVTSTPSYGIWQITPTSPSSPDYIQSSTGGGQNLLTTPEALVQSGTGWSGPLVNGTISGTLTSISGVTAVSTPYVQSTQWGSSYGEDDYGNGAFGQSFPVPVSYNNYSFLINASGTGTATVYVTYSGASGNTTLSGSYALNGYTPINFNTTQASGTSTAWVSVSLSGGKANFSNAGFFVGQQSNWVAPLTTSGMRISAVSRIYLPTTNNGTYRCSLYSGTTELAHKQFSNIPPRTWVDIEVPFTLTSGYYNYSNFSTRLTQTNGQGESYQIALFGTFYNPVSWEYSSNNGDTWDWITTGLNNPESIINLRAPSNQIQVKGHILQDQSSITALSIVPNYTQSPYYSTTPINYIGDPRTNQLTWKLTPGQRPLFQLGSELHPVAYDIGVLMNIFNPYNLD